MMDKPLPPPLDLVKNEVNRFLADLLQRGKKNTAQENSVANSSAVQASAAPEKEKTAGQIDFVSAKPAAAKKTTNISDFFAALPVEIVAEYERRLGSISTVVAQELDGVFRQVLVKPEKKDKKKHKQEVDGLALIDDEELMFRLVLDHFSTKINEQYKIGIALVCLRFEKVLGFEIDLLLSPLAPFVIGSALEKAIAPLQLDVGNKKQLLMAILKGLIVEYAQLLKLANEIFIKKGILPKLTENDAKARIDKYLRKMKAEEEGLDDEGESGKDGDGEGPSAFARDFFKEIAIPQESEHFVVSNPNGVLIPQAQLLNNIGSMQSVLVSTDQQSGYMQPVQTESTFSELLAANSDIGEYALTAEHSKTIGIISMLFDTLKTEESISGPMKALLLQLTVPLLKAAVQDDEFFSDNANPAQVLFNSIAEASSSWTAESSASNDFLYKKMSEIVQRVTEDYAEDYTVFESAVDDFETFVDTEKQKTQRIEDRIIANETAQARIKAARKIAQDRVFKAFGDFILDEQLKDFFDKSWEQALFYIANNTIDDENNPQWQQVEKIENQLASILNYESPGCSLDDIFASITRLLVTTGRSEPDVKAELANIRPELQVLVDDADEDGDAKPKPVATAHPVTAQPAAVAQSRAGMTGDDDVEADDELDTVDVAMVLDAEGEISSDIDDYEKNYQAAQQAKMQELLGTVAIGCWFEDKEAEPPAKVKLAAHIKYTDTYVFVNRKGVKAASLDGPSLALRMQDKTMEMVVDNANYYDRSMEAIIGNLRH